MLAELEECHPGGGHEFDLLLAVQQHGGRRRKPAMLMNLTIVDDDITQRRGGCEEPGAESAPRPALCGQRPRGRRLPMRPRDQVGWFDPQTSFLVAFPGGSTTSGDEFINRIDLMGIDTATGEHPGTTERDRRVSAKHQDLGSLRGVSQ